ncbi:MAG: alpha-amylase, partial [Promethearchaeota archaeon]
MKKNTTPWTKHPRIYEINTWPWLQKASEDYGHRISLENVPIDLIDKNLRKFDVIWTMGVWERSPKGREIAIRHEGLQEEYQKALRYFGTDDVIGSPYAVYYYHVDSHLGGNEGLTTFREDLAERNIKLMLDYVPNHVAIDHLWTLEKSDMFMKGTLEDLMTKPYEYFSIGQKVYAHGKDPNFSPWTDTIQINAFSNEAREKTVNTLLSIADICDGVRCDMAMLVSNEVFVKTWGSKAGEVPDTDFWEYIIPKVKEKNPEFKFIAEVYWDLEWKLQQQGFDYTYDKRLYERLLNDDAPKIKDHLQADWDYQCKLLRYIENHDEERVINLLGEDASKAAAVLIMTLPGARMIHEGQMEGNEIRIPIQLGRFPTENRNNELYKFYEYLLDNLPAKDFNDAEWKMCEVDSINDNSYLNVISYVWSLNDQM